MKHRTAVALLGLLASLGAALPLAAETLPSDSRNIRGSLPNGLNWIFRSHANPPGKIAVLLHIETGSLNESESQRGLAHFLEHMVFNGTEHYPPGQLLPYFESIGMEFGADLNASTGFETTRYMLFLPNTDPAELDRALVVLSDFAFRASLLQTEIDKERGIILSEKRARDNVAMRLQEKEWQTLYGDARFANRIPIGTEEVISQAGRDRFAEFYNTWYRPDKMTVIVVGDTTADIVTPLIEKHFGAATAAGPEPAPHAAGVPQPTTERALVLTDPEYKYCSLEVQRILPGRPPGTTIADYRTELVERLAERMISRRYAERLRRGDAHYQGASASIERLFADAMSAAARVQCTPANWEKSLHELLEEVNRVREHGFRAYELELARKATQAGAERAVKTEATNNANAILYQLSGAIETGEPVLSAAQRLELTQKLLPEITCAEVTDRFNALFTPEKFTAVLTIDPAAENVPTDEALLAATRAAFARKTSPLPDEAEEQPLIAGELRPGAIQSQSTDAALGITHFQLSNGVRGHFRPMDYKKDSVFVSINLAGGVLTEESDTLGISEVAGLAFSQPATSRLSSTEIQDRLTGQNIRVTGGAAGDKLSVRIIGSPEQLELALQLAYSLLTDGQIEESAFDTWQSQRLQQLQLLRSFPEFAGARTLNAVMSGDDPRLRIDDAARIEGQDRSKAQAWLDRQLASAPIEVAIVGEIEQEQALALAAKYLGALPQRADNAAHLDSYRKLRRGDGPFEEVAQVPTGTPKAFATYGFMSAPAGASDEQLALQLAAQVLSTRLINDLREDRAWVYSIGANNTVRYSFEDYCALTAGSTCAPENARRVTHAIAAQFGKFAESGPTDEELANAKKQLLNNLDTQMKEPSFWWNLLEDADRYAINLKRYENPEALVNTVPSAQVRETFAKYYQPARQFTVIAVPEGAEMLAPESESAAGAAAPVGGETR